MMDGTLAFLWNDGGSTEAMTSALMVRLPRHKWHLAHWYDSPLLAHVVSDGLCAAEAWYTQREDAVRAASDAAIEAREPGISEAVLAANRRAVFVGADRAVCQRYGAYVADALRAADERLTVALLAVEAGVVDEMRATLRAE